MKNDISISVVKNILYLFPKLSMPINSTYRNLQSSDFQGGAYAPLVGPGKTQREWVVDVSCENICAKN